MASTQDFREGLIVVGAIVTIVGGILTVYEVSQYYKNKP